MPHYLLVIIFAILMLPGLVGVFLPFLPSIPYMFLAALVFLVFDQFRHLSGIELAVLGIITVVSLAVDYLSGLLGAKYGGASGKAIFAGIIGFLAGTILLPPFGGIAGLFLGVLFYELLINKDRQKAVRAATGSLVGTLGGMVINFVLAVTFLVMFIIFAR